MQSAMNLRPRKKQPKFSLARHDDAMEDLVRATDQKTLAVWATECAERVMPHFEKAFPDDSRPRDALITLRAWIDTGTFSMPVIRRASLGSHAAARDVGNDTPARSAARAAGHAVATAHVPRHSLGSAIYAQQAVWRASEPEDADAAVAKERDWQYRRLVELRDLNEPRH